MLCPRCIQRGEEHTMGAVGVDEVEFMCPVCKYMKFLRRRKRREVLKDMGYGQETDSKKG